MSAEETALRALIETMTRALHDKNAADVTACYTADISHFSMAPPLKTTGREADGLQSWFDTWEGPIGLRVGDLALAIDTEVAFGHTISRMSGLKRDGERIDLWFRQTFGFCKIAGAWKIAHQHQSVPFYMDGSYRAAIDLQP